MAVKEVLLLGNPILREISQPVNDYGDELQKRIHDLRDTLHAKQAEMKTGRAMAAPQIGVLQRIVCFEMPSRRFMMINPEIVDRSPEQFWVWDDCFSFDMAFFVRIRRFQRVTVQYRDETGKHYTEDFHDAMSELMQHEIDHLHGILAVDHLKSFDDMVMRSEYEKRFKGKNSDL